MIGVLFLFTVAVWIALSIWAALKVSKFAVTGTSRTLVGIGVLLFMLALPFIDEFIGKHQFENLCKANGIETADLSKARGKAVKVEYGQRRPVEGVLLAVTEGDVRFRDATTGEVLISHKTYYSKGGWVMSFTWLSLGSNHPMLFSPDCLDFEARRQAFTQHSITQVN